MRRSRQSRRNDWPGEFDLRSEHGVRAAYAMHGPELYRFALRQLGDEGRARDVVQEVFLRAWRAAESFDAEVGSLRVWLFAIARNAVVDEVRRVRARPVRLVDDRALATLAHGDLAHDESVMTSWLVEEAMRRITPEHRAALVETYLRGRPYPEVAHEQEIPVGTLRSRVFYGLKALRLAMDEMGVEP
ncbi:sigma-70 family RNA polymerase sigma factor [Allosaccharopolyspora coralli]|uniref:Sigma-70 family RNA polymerase sigma factor n=1 Tax=Allosaccharopolyspora coralli TaxID=2665642 RepID=A0A5Q3QEA2_9PSEU|nr:sigma-70 family RNA polymerase sigma factor [Allosaccharopolyspora coralli]QGK69835.1 sigma-70 family RNA polymerase sigma factor [Allosaccharopolyspora coralli]